MTENESVPYEKDMHKGNEIKCILQKGTKHFFAEEKMRKIHKIIK